MIKVTTFAPALREKHGSLVMKKGCQTEKKLFFSKSLVV